jgi:hypothetical protein
MPLGSVSVKAVHRTLMKLSPNFRRVQDFIVGGMDRFFYNHGKRVASHPFAYIAFCLFVTGVNFINVLHAHFSYEFFTKAKT